MVHTRNKQHSAAKNHPPLLKRWDIVLPLGIAAVVIAIVLFLSARPSKESPYAGRQPSATTAKTISPGTRLDQPGEEWLQRAYAIDQLFQAVYTPCWEGANGAIGDAFLFATTRDSSLLLFHTQQHSMIAMCAGTWVDDRAWVCLAELYWWKVTGRGNMPLVSDAAARYLQARNEGRLSNHEGYWTWYNWPPGSTAGERAFTNSNMNQMVSVACRLYEATGNRSFLDDALLVWNGDHRLPGIEKALYRGKGHWEGKGGRAAFGKELPWGGAEYCSIGAALFHATGDLKYKKIVVETARHMLDPEADWVDQEDFYQLRMDGNGNFVQYLLDAFMIAPDELPDIPQKVERMLTHVWTNAHARATVTLHRETDNGIRNGWNPHGGEDGYGVDEVGTVHAQSQAVRALGVFSYVKYGRKSYF